MTLALEEFAIALDHFIEVNIPITKNRLLASIERKVEKAMRYAFALQGKAFLRRFGRLKLLLPTEVISEAIVDSDWIPLFDQAELETIEAFVRPIDDAVQAALLAGGQQAMADFLLTGSFELANPRAVLYLRDYGAKLVKGINETTRDYIKTMITEGVEQGWSYNRMAKAITDRYQEFRIGQPQKHIDSRAHLIAVTESGNAYERGNMIVAEELEDAGLEMEKSWLVAGGNICDFCLGNEAEGWIPLDQEFSSGHMQPVAHPACRCTALYRRVGAE